jgi:hypothetical protein
MNAQFSAFEYWPRLPLKEWQDTYGTLHMWTQIVGKVRLKQAPHVNHGWQVPLYVTPRGLTTSPIPYGRRVSTKWARDWKFGSKYRLLVRFLTGE